MVMSSREGVYVQASTLRSLVAMLEFLETPAVNIPVRAISIGPVHKKDVMRASAMLEKKKREYATIFAFGVEVNSEASQLASQLGVKIFTSDITNQLFHQFKAYMYHVKEENNPCVLRIIPNCVFNTKDPIVLGVHVVQGIAKIGTPICVPMREFVEIGRISSIQNNHVDVDYAEKGQNVAIKIIGRNPEERKKMVGRHFEVEDVLVTKNSIYELKKHDKNSIYELKKHYFYYLKDMDFIDDQEDMESID